MQQVGVFTATRWELNAVRRALRVDGERRVAGSRCLFGRSGNHRLWLFQVGVGVDKASAVCREALATQPLDLAVSSGFACALIPSQIGELLIGTEVVHRGDASEPSGPVDVLPCSGFHVKMALDAAKRADVPARTGRFVTVSRVLWRAWEKGDIAAGTGAIGLDMESAAIGAAARDRQVPFLVVRAVSDLQDEDLPLDFNRCLTPAGWMRGAAACLIRPSRLLGLSRLGAHCATASKRITTFFQAFADGLDGAQLR